MSDIREPLDQMVRGGFDFDDFEKNGVLLPATEQVAFETGQPLHRGPHPRYNQLVIDRLFLIIKLCDRIDNEVQRQAFFV